MVQNDQISNASLAYNIQPVVSSMIREGNARGGNSCGLSDISQSCMNPNASTSPACLLLYVLSLLTYSLGWSFVVQWDDEADDVAGQQTSDSFRGSLETTAQSQDLLLRYRFMNHASFTQTVLDTYGPENVERFRSVAATYDPQGIFQELQNDGFLLRKI